MSYFARFILVPVLLFPSMGCAVFKSQEEKDKQAYEVKKTRLERQVELLRLERRKLMLERSLDRMDSVDPTLEDEQS